MKRLSKLLFGISLLPFVVVGFALGVGLTGAILGWKLAFDLLAWFGK